MLYWQIKGRRRVCTKLFCLPAHRVPSFRVCFREKNDQDTITNHNNPVGLDLRANHAQALPVPPSLLLLEARCYYLLRHDTGVGNTHTKYVSNCLGGVSIACICFKVCSPRSRSFPIKMPYYCTVFSWRKPPFVVIRVSPLRPSFFFFVYRNDCTKRASSWT